MSTQFLEQCIEDENLRNKIRESLPEDKREEINNLFSRLEMMFQVSIAPTLHAMFIAPVATFVIIVFQCHFNGLSLQNDFWFLFLMSLVILFLAYKAAFHSLTLLYGKYLNQIQQEIARDFKNNVDLWELLWLIRAKSCHSDREIATQVMQKLLKETFSA